MVSKKSAIKIKAHLHWVCHRIWTSGVGEPYLSGEEVHGALGADPLGCCTPHLLKDQSVSTLALFIRDPSLPGQ